MTRELTILWRGDLSSCNYACTYCPFAKTKNTREELLDDAEDLRRFVDWVEAEPDVMFSILFTPWGEAMIRPHYQAAFERLSAMANVKKVVAQTNLSCRLEWTERCDKSKIALWCTYHPTQTSEAQFLEKCQELKDRDVTFSVGIVGLKENLDGIEQMRGELSEDVYLWVNAYKREPNYYDDAELDRIRAVDPLFDFNNRYHESLGHTCRAGDTVVSVDGDGNAKRCHFIDTPIGNIYDDSFWQTLRPTPCSNTTCGCYIGYVHLERLDLYAMYGERVLERVFIV